MRRLGHEFSALRKLLETILKIKTNMMVKEYNSLFQSLDSSPSGTAIGWLRPLVLSPGSSLSLKQISATTSTKSSLPMTWILALPAMNLQRISCRRLQGTSKEGQLGVIACQCHSMKGIRTKHISPWSDAMSQVFKEELSRFHQPSSLQCEIFPGLLHPTLAAGI